MSNVKEAVINEEELGGDVGLTTVGWFVWGANGGARVGVIGALGGVGWFVRDVGDLVGLPCGSVGPCDSGGTSSVGLLSVGTDVLPVGPSVGASVLGGGVWGDMGA